jgi:hypothetical protein
MKRHYQESKKQAKHVTHICLHSTQEAETEGCKFKASLGYTSNMLTKKRKKKAKRYPTK